MWDENLHLPCGGERLSPDAALTLQIGNEAHYYEIAT
jgi:hypothetical protein